MVGLSDKRALRVVLIVYNTTGKGTYRRAFQFGKHLAQRGHDVTLLATSRMRRSGVECSGVNNVNVVESPDLFSGSLRSGWDPWNTLNRIKWLHKYQFDVVHVFEARPTVLLPGLYLQRTRRIPLVMDWADWFGRGGSVEQRTNPLVRAVLRPVETFFEERFRTQADGTTVICTTLQDKAVALGVPPNSIMRLLNGSDVQQFFPMAAAEVRQQIGIPDNGFIIGYMGSIFRGDAQLMAHAFDLICAQSADVKLLMIGYGGVNIRQLVAMPERVIQTGFVREELLNAYLNVCDLCWLPLCDTNANRGRFPLKLNDYMAAGRATVASAVGDVTTLLEEEPVGLLAADNADSFATQTLRLLRAPALRARMGTHARQVAETRFNWMMLTEQLESFYQRIIELHQSRLAQCALRQ